MPVLLLFKIIATLLSFVWFLLSHFLKSSLVLAVKEGADASAIKHIPTEQDKSFGRTLILMLTSEKYGVLVFKSASDKSLYSFWGDSVTYKAMAKGTSGSLYGIGNLAMTELDRVADGANVVLKRFNEGEKIDVLKELRKYHVGWNEIKKTGDV